MNKFAKLSLIIFLSLFGGSNRERGGNRKIEKLKCIFHYFKRVTDKSKQQQMPIFFFSLRELI